MYARTVCEWQLRAMVQHVLAAAVLILSCGSFLAGSLYASTRSARSGLDAEHPCPACRARAEQLRGAADLLIKRATYTELNKAVEQLQQSARLFQQDHATAEVAVNYLKIAEVYKIWGRYRLELEKYEQAGRLARDSDIDLRCSILSHRALAYVDSNVPKALGFANQAITLSKSSSNPLILAEALEAFGQASFAQDKPEMALDAFHSAIDLFREAKDVDGEARVWLVTGYATFQGDTALADSFSGYQEAFRLWTATNNVRGIARVRLAMALYWIQTGDIQKATDELNQAQATFHKAGDRDNEAVVLIERGGMSDEIGGYEDSLRYYRKARNVFAAIGDLRAEIGAIDGAAHAEWTLHHPQRARQLDEMKLRLAKLVGLPRYRADAKAGLGNYYALQGNFRKAESLYLEALGMFRSLNEEPAEAPLLIRLGHLYSQKGHDEQALSKLQNAIDIASRNQQLAELAKARFEIASMRQRQGWLEDANNEIEMVLKIIESQRTKMLDFDDRASYFASVHEYYQLYIDTLMQLDRQNPGQDFALKALEASEKSKVRSLLDMLGYDSPALALSDIQSEIRGDNTVILEYALGKERGYLWVIDADRATPYPISNPARDLSRLCERFRDSLMASGLNPAETPQQRHAREKRASRYHHDQQELAKALLGPAFGSIQGKRVIIVPDGFLQYVPFAALLSSKNSDLVILPSASTLKALRDAAQKRKPATDAVVVFANPVYERDDERVTGKFSSGKQDFKPESVKQVTRDVLGSPYIPRLLDSHYEAAAIAKASGQNRVVIREGFEANREAALQLLSRFRYIHFATHEFLDTHRPERSGLVLSMVNKNGKAQDGYLRLRDIYSLELSADLVVLSACQSALGRDLDSEGMIGLTRAFLHAGSSRVISTLWRVDDQATAALMSYFYHRLSRGQSPSVALRGAQSDLAKLPEWKHPYYWAAFVLQGEYRWDYESK